MGYDHEKKKVKIEDPMVEDMESRLRSCVESHRDELCSAELERSTEAFADQVVDRIISLKESSDQGQIDDESALKPTIKIVSIDVPPVHVQRIVRKQVDRGNLNHFFQSIRGDRVDTSPSITDDLASTNYVEKTHVTMQFWKSTTQESMRELYGKLLGSEVKLVVTALLWDDDVAAFQVEIPEKAENGIAIPPCGNKFCHLTIWVADDIEARMANELPDKVEAGGAFKVVFTDPIPLEGVVSFWNFENNPLPIDQC